MNENDQIQLIKDYKQVFSTLEGKRVLADLENELGLNSRSVRDAFGANVVERTFYNEGTRAAILYIKSMVDTDLDSLTNLLQKRQLERESQ